MTNYSKNIGGFEGSFQGVSGITPKADNSAQKNSAFLELASRFAGGMAKGYAKGEGKRTSGMDLSNEDVEASVGLFEDEVGIATGVANREGGEPLTEGQKADIRNAAMDELGLTTREIKRLVAEDKISSTEAQARIDMMLSEKLSNPFLAMYETDFQNTVAQYTGDIGMSPTEKDNALKAAAKKKATEELYELKAKYEAAGANPEAAQNKAISYLRYRNDNEYRNKELANGNLTDVPVILKTFSDNTRFFFDDLSKNFLGNEQFLDDNGMLNTEGLQGMKREVSRWTAEQSAMIASSNLRGADLADAQGRITSVAKTLESLTTKSSQLEYYKAAKELGVNATDAMFLQTWPLTHVLMRNGMQNLAKTFFYAKDKGRQGRTARQILEGQGFNAQAIDYQYLGRFFDPNIGTFAAGDVPGGGTEDVLVDAANHLTETGEMDEVGDQLGKEKKAHLKMLAEESSKNTIEYAASNENVLKAVKEGDVTAQEDITKAFSLFHRTLTSMGDLDGDLGEVAITKNYKRGRFSNQPDNYPTKVTWTKAGARGLKEKKKEVAAAYRQIYLMHKMNEEMVPDPIEATNQWLATGKLDFASLATGVDAPPTDADLKEFKTAKNRPVPSTKKKAEAAAATEKAREKVSEELSKLSEDELIQLNQNMPDGPGKDAVNKALSDLVEGQLNG